MKRKYFGLMILVFGLSLTAACSKNLMPPEELAGGSVAESEVSETASDGSVDGFDRSGDSGPGFNISEQTVGESGAFTTSGPEGSGSADASADSGSGDMASSDSRDFGSESGGMPDDGYTGHGTGDPFSGGSGSADASADSGSGDMASSGSRDFGSGSGMPGDGYTGHHKGDPFSGGSDGEVAAKTGDGDKEARLQTFSPTRDLSDIHFKFDKHDLDDGSRAILRKNASFLKANPMAKIEIQGHCDERGTNNYNIALGERRAQSTKMYLVSQGINASRIHTISYGEEKPFCFDRNESCWLDNRRAHFMIGR
jgi:peptidoglycan-associated lipoprotein